MHDAEHGTGREQGSVLEPRTELLPRPRVHADGAPLVAFAVAHEDRAALGIEVALVERERFADAQTGSPEGDDQPGSAVAVDATASLSHDEDDLLDGRGISGVAAAFVP